MEIKRKEKRMPQAQLAAQLNVTDKALEVSVLELMQGERRTGRAEIN